MKQDRRPRTVVPINNKTYGVHFLVEGVGSRLCELQQQQQQQKKK